MDDFNFSDLEMEILNESAELFTGESIQEIRNKILQYQTAAIKLRNLLESAQKGNRAARKNLTPMMKSAYMTIMGFRNSLLGTTETISYRIYIRGNDINSVSIVNLTEEQLMKYVERSGNSLRLKRNLDKVTQLEHDAKAEALFQAHFANISRSLVHKHGNNFVVPYEEVSDVVSSQIGSALYWQESATKQGPHPYTPKMFNRGWIYQAFDATIYSLSQNHDISTVTTATTRQEYFTNQLKYDNVVGFKGGDVGLNQIKSNMANLMNITTLISYLTIIIDILSPENYVKKEDLKQKILQEFTETGQISNAANITVNNVIDNLLSILNKT